MIATYALRLPQFIKFIISGGINTVITYGIYLILLLQFSYQLSYTIAYASGLVISYFLSRLFVFQSHKGMKSLLLFPLIYVVQYGFGILILWLCIDKAGISDKIAPLIVIAITIPVTYLLSRFVFVTDKIKQ